MTQKVNGYLRATMVLPKKPLNRFTILMGESNMNRLTTEQIPCKYDHTYWEQLGEKWMGRCEMWECLWFEQAPDDTQKAIDIEAEIDKPDFKCSPKCAGYSPVITTICKKHDAEYFEECPDCMKENDAAQDAKREELE